MSLIFNPEVTKCFAPCAESLNGKWCQCQVVPKQEVTFEQMAEAFKQQMIKENTDNAHKGNILDWDNIEEMILEHNYHTVKLYSALEVNDLDRVKEHLADCANYLLAIGNTLKLYK